MLKLQSDTLFANGLSQTFAQAMKMKLRIAVHFVFRICLCRDMGVKCCCAVLFSLHLRLDELVIWRGAGL